MASDFMPRPFFFMYCRKSRSISGVTLTFICFIQPIIQPRAVSATTLSRKCLGSRSVLEYRTSEARGLESSLRQVIETLVNFLQFAQNFFSKIVLVGRRLSLQEESAAGLKDRGLDFVDIGKALPVAYREQFRFGEQLLG